MPLETVTFRGESASQLFDGWSGFRIGQTYTLAVERPGDGTVVLELAGVHPHVGPGAVKVLSEAEYKRWFRPA